MEWVIGIIVLCLILAAADFLEEQKEAITKLLTSYSEYLQVKKEYMQMEIKKFKGENRD